ncbi:MAG TPA: hypothetical protein VF144_00590 [Chitinophagaceae bacterium]
MNALLIIVSFLLLPTLIICFLAILEGKRKKQIKKDLRKIVDHSAKENNLRVSEVHIFHRKAIAMDRRKEKMIFVNLHEAFVDQFCIDLKTLVSCRVIILKSESSKDVEKVLVEVKNKGFNEVSRLVFYDRYFDKIRTKTPLMREAEYWKNKIDLHRRSTTYNNLEFVL